MLRLGTRSKQLLVLMFGLMDYVYANRVMLIVFIIQQTQVVYSSEEAFPSNVSRCHSGDLWSFPVVVS